MHSTNNTSEVTDVVFTETKVDKSAENGKQFFNPVVFLTDALRAAKYPDPEGWTKDIDLRAQTAENEKDRIFFANRAIRLYLSEQEDRENLSPRMLLADGIDSVKWMALMDQGIVPWLMNQFDKKGKRIKPEIEQTPSEDKDIEKAPFVLGVDVATGKDQTGYASIATTNISNGEAGPVGDVGPAGVTNLEVPPPHFANGQWNGAPISDFPHVQEELRKGLEDGTIQIQGSVGEIGSTVPEKQNPASES